MTKKRTTRKSSRGSKPQKAPPRSNTHPRPSIEPEDGAGIAALPDEIENAPLEVLEEEIPHLEHFWQNVMRAAGCEPHSPDAIRGASGVPHRLISAGIDEPGHRLVIISGEPDARSAALAQSDIQAAMSRDLRVLVARPILMSAQDLALGIARTTGRSRLSLKDLETFGSRPEEERNQLGEALAPQLQPLMETVAQWIRNAQSLQSFRLLEVVQQILEQIVRIHWITPDGPGADLTDLFAGDPAIEDIPLGTCGFPLFAFSGDEMETVNSGTDLDEIRRLLRKHNVFQYFFPPPDQLALGLVERQPQDETAIVRQLEQSARLGHPHAVNELLGEDVQLVDLIDALKERKFLVGGEVSLELTPEGESVRHTIRYTPREGTVSKILNRFNVSLDVSKLLKP